MSFDLDLAERLRDALASTPEVTERKMFGGLAFLVAGHMTVVASGRGGVMLRADPATTEALVETTPARLAEMRGRPLQGWLVVDDADLVGDRDLDQWVDLALRYVATLPPKT